MKKLLIIALLIVGCEDKIDNEQIVSKYLDSMKTLNKEYAEKYANIFSEKLHFIRDTMYMPPPKDVLSKAVENLDKIIKSNTILKKDSVYIEFKNKENNIIESYCYPLEICDYIEGIVDYQIIKSDEKRVWLLLKQEFEDGSVSEKELIYTIDEEKNKIAKIFLKNSTS